MEISLKLGPLMGGPHVEYKKWQGLLSLNWPCPISPPKCSHVTCRHIAHVMSCSFFLVMLLCRLSILKRHTIYVMHIKPQEIQNLSEHSWTFTKSKGSLWQTTNHEILAKPHQTDMYSCLLLLLWIHTKSDDTTPIVIIQASSYSVHTVCFCETWT